MSSFRRGFTLIELLMAIAIIAILAGMLLAVLSILRNKTKVAQTWDLMTHVTTAIDQYMHDYQRLGDTPVLFQADPWYFFYKEQQGRKSPALLELALSRVVTKTGTGTCSPAASLKTATHLLDYFGANPSNVLSFYILNDNKGSGAAFAYTQCMILRSSAGTTGDTKDDLLFAWSSDKGSWRKMRVEDLTDFLTDLDRVPKLTTTEIDEVKKWTNPLLP
jgi:prepilin-type N-terminal cleavage/methylation domain-containing protein